MPSIYNMPSIMKFQKIYSFCSTALYVGLRLETITECLKINEKHVKCVEESKCMMIHQYPRDLYI